MVLGWGEGSPSCPLIPRLGMVVFRGPIRESFRYLTHFHSRLVSGTEVDFVHYWFVTFCNLKKIMPCNEKKNVMNL